MNSYDYGSLTEHHARRLLRFMHVTDSHRRSLVQFEKALMEKESNKRFFTHRDDRDYYESSSEGGAGEQILWGTAMTSAATKDYQYFQQDTSHNVVCWTASRGDNEELVVVPNDAGSTPSSKLLQLSSQHLRGRRMRRNTKEREEEEDNYCYLDQHSTTTNNHKNKDIENDNNNSSSSYSLHQEEEEGDEMGVALMKSISFASLSSLFSETSDAADPRPTSNNGSGTTKYSTIDSWDNTRDAKIFGQESKGEHGNKFDYIVAETQYQEHSQNETVFTDDAEDSTTTTSTSTTDSSTSSRRRRSRRKKPRALLVEHNKFSVTSSSVGELYSPLTRSGGGGVDNKNQYKWW